LTPEVSFLGIKLGLGQVHKFGGARTLEEDRKSIDEQLRKLDKRIVITIDDTDRLDVEETKLVFKLVKMTANFPNTVFILAYDRAKVAKKIEEEGLPGEEYLKKIGAAGPLSHPNTRY
jgi:predicted KAP-like P-loop ATPase